MPGPATAVRRGPGGPGAYAQRFEDAVEVTSIFAEHDHCVRCGECMRGERTDTLCFDELLRGV